MIHGTNTATLILYNCNISLSFQSSYGEKHFIGMAYCPRHILCIWTIIPLHGQNQRSQQYTALSKYLENLQRRYMGSSALYLLYYLLHVSQHNRNMTSFINNAILNMKRRILWLIYGNHHQLERDITTIPDTSIWAQPQH